MKLYQCLNCSKDCFYGIAKSNKYCDNKCQIEYQYKKYITEWKLGIKSGIRGKDQVSSYIKRYLLQKFSNKCSKCGIDSWEGEPITLEIEHKDGNSLNQAEENLILLCPNCHSQTLTYKARNKGNGRHSRKQRYQEGKSY